MYQRARFFDKEIKIAEETIKILNWEIDKGRKCLEKIKKECVGDKKQIEKMETKVKCVLKEMKLENSCES